MTAPFHYSVVRDWRSRACEEFDMALYLPGETPQTLQCITGVEDRRLIRKTAAEAASGGSVPAGGSWPSLFEAAAGTAVAVVGCGYEEDETIGDQSDGGLDSPASYPSDAEENRAPEWTPPRDQYVRETFNLDLKLVATDPDGDPVTFRSEELPLHASLSPDGHFFWNPFPDQQGTWKIPVSVSDGKAVTSGNLTVHVLDHNRAPSLDSIPAQTVREGTTLTFPIFASDPDGDLVSLSSGPLPAGALLFDNTFEWTPTFDQAGVYSVTFFASDGRETSSQTVEVTVLDTP